MIRRAAAAEEDPAVFSMWTIRGNDSPEEDEERRVKLAAISPLHFTFLEDGLD